jgi:predicted metal-dependent hydrolase
MDSLFAQGIEQFNNGEYFECHETLEEYWNSLHGDEKLFVQGVIQAAVACYHAGRGNWRGAASQYEKSISKLERFGPRRSGVELADFVSQLRTCRQAVATAQASPPGTIPPVFHPHIRCADRADSLN